MSADIVRQSEPLTIVDDTDLDANTRSFASEDNVSFDSRPVVADRADSSIVQDALTRIDSRPRLFAVTESSQSSNNDYLRNYESQTTVQAKTYQPPADETAEFDSSSSENKKLQNPNDSVLKDTRTSDLSAAGLSSENSLIYEDSSKYSTHAEHLLNADPFYRITRAKRSRIGKTGSGKGFAYGIHRLVRPHVKGGMGTIHIAYDQFLKREVALKELFENATNDELVVHRFIVEAEITAQLEHPGIIPVHALGLDLNGNPYYTMKLIQGKTFQEAIRQYFKDPREQELKRLVRRFVSVCQTMSFVHSKGVIHRDLKPANIMLSDHGETLVMDWGIAKAYNKELATGSGISLTKTSLQTTGDGELSPELTQVGTVVGTPAFMSPEQASPDSQEVGPASDVFSLGAILFYLLTGRNAYTGKTPQEILVKVLTMDPPRPSEVAKNVPAGLEAICMKAMARNVKERYQTTDRLVADVCNWLDGEPISVLKETLNERIWRYFFKHRHMSIGVLLMVLVFFATLTLAVILIDRGRERAKFRGVESAAIAQRNAEIEQEIFELDKELVTVQEECEAYRRDRDSTNSDVLRAGYDKKFNESLFRISILESQIDKLIWTQKELQDINETIRKEK